MITFTKFTMNEIYKWTDANYHNISRAYTSKMMGENGLAKLYMDIDKRHQVAGSLTSELYNERKKLDETLKAVGLEKVANWHQVWNTCF